MANHIRTQIRDRVATACTGLSTTGTNVFKARARRLGDAKLPALVIYTESEQIPGDLTSGNIGSRTFTRVIDLVVEGYAKDTANVDTTLDTIAKEVETAVAGVTIDDTLHDIEPVETEKELNGDGEQIVGVVKVTFRAWTRTAEGVPDVGVP
jgi:hypothetical protein